MQFTTSLLDLYDAVKSPRPYAKDLDDSIKYNIIELHYSYMQYMRVNIRKFKEFTFSMLTNSLDAQVHSRQQLLQLAWPLLFLVLLLLLWGVVATTRRLKMTITEVFS